MSLPATAMDPGDFSNRFGCYRRAHRNKTDNSFVFALKADIVTALTTDNEQAEKITETYRVVFWGEVARGHHRNQVAQAFAKTFKIRSRRQLVQLFSGKVITLKRNLRLTDAHRYITVIQSMGGICRMEREMKEYFFETEIKERREVSFLNNEHDMEALALAPKE